MAIVVSLAGFLPPARYDAVAWTRVQVQEAAEPAGAWSQIDDQALPSPDADPSSPALRNVTTRMATLPTGWYRLVFSDAQGGVSQPSDPVRNSTEEAQLPPTPEQVRAGSPLLRGKFPLPPADPFQLSDLRTIVYQATALVQSITWRLIDPTLGCPAPDGYSCEAVPASLVPTALEAVTRMVERIYVTTEPQFAEELATGRRKRSISAGPWAESYFAPGEFARRGASQGRPAMDADDALDAALWALATEDARDYFIMRSTGVMPPTGVVSSFDYRREQIGYGAGSLGGWPARGAGPDGF